MKIAGPDVGAVSIQMALEFKELSRNSNPLAKLHQWWCPAYAHVWQVTVCSAAGAAPHALSGGFSHRGCVSWNRG